MQELEELRVQMGKEARREKRGSELESGGEKRGDEQRGQEGEEGCRTGEWWGEERR